MMLQSTDRRKIYFYLFLLFFLLSIHNFNHAKTINSFFKVNNIILSTDIPNSSAKKIYLNLEKFYDTNIFMISSKEIVNELNNFNIISDFKIRKEYPSVLKIYIKKTKVLAYYFEDAKIIFIGDNGKKITQYQSDINNLPMIIGNFEINNFLELTKILEHNDFHFVDFNKLYFFKTNRWDLLYKNKITIKLPTNDLGKSIGLLKNIIKSLDINKIKIIDLRIKNNVILS